MLAVQAVQPLLGQPQPAARRRTEAVLLRLRTARLPAVRARRPRRCTAVARRAQLRTVAAQRRLLRAGPRRRIVLEYHVVIAISS